MCKPKKLNKSSTWYIREKNGWRPLRIGPGEAVLGYKGDVFTAKVVKPTKKES